MREHIYSPKKIFYKTNKFEPGRPTLVFVHGISGSSSAWLPYEKKFEADFNVLSFDLRGHGNSWKPKHFEDYTMEKFSEDLFDLVNFLKIKRFILISHSFGSLIALEFMTRHLNMIEKAVFLSPNFSPKRILAGKIVQPFLKLFTLFNLMPLNQEGRGQVDYSLFKNTGDWNIRRMIADVGKTSLRVYLWGSGHVFKVDYEKLIHQIKIPVLIMHGKKDTIFPWKNSFVMQQKIKNSQLILLDRSDHILVLNDFSEVSEAIGKFITPFLSA